MRNSVSDTPYNNNHFSHKIHNLFVYRGERRHHRSAASLAPLFPMRLKKSQPQGDSKTLRKKLVKANSRQSSVTIY